MKFFLLIELLRPQQWLKNLMLFFPPLLSGAIFHPAIAARGVLPFAAFCCASSTMYVFNDLIDQKRDIFHPVKKSRPLASGQVSHSLAVVICLLMFITTMLLSWQLSIKFILLVCVYMLVMVFYSLILKDLPIIDLFCISLGFVLRLYSGGEAFNVFISDWLFLTVFLLSIFLSVGKRYSEKYQLGCDAGSHRRSLEVYPEGFLESALYLSGSAVLVTYSIYAISTSLLVYSVPICLFGLLRYLMRIKSGRSGDPTDAFLRDVPLLITGVLWVALVGWCVYQ